MLNTLAHKSLNDVDTIKGAWPPPVTRSSRFFGLCVPRLCYQNVDLPLGGMTTGAQRSGCAR